MRAFADIESRFAAARVVFHQRRTADADATATLARIQGEISPTEVARPMSRRQICERRELPLPPPSPHWRFDSRHWGTVSLDASLLPGMCGLGAPVSGDLQQEPYCWPCKPVAKPAVTPPGMPDLAHADIVADHGLFARLILRRVRAQGSSASDSEQSDRFSDHRKLAPVSAASKVASASISRSARPATTGAADAPDSPVAPLETQLAELAWRRLRGLGPRKRP
jgi:hypothetical protein